jgi:peptidoglycan/xylan/chitin deacetylase (PgdA/CDA1 family)
MTRQRQIFRKTKVVLTVDTEASIGGVFSGAKGGRPLIHELVAGVIDGKSHGLGFVVETLARHDLTATFFVETAQTRYFPERVMGGYAERLLHAGQDVQLHLHPGWLSFNNGEVDRSQLISDHCHEFETDRLAALIDEGAELIRRWTGMRPSGMRAGNFSASLSVFEAMRATGLSCASNICLAVNRPPEPELAVAGGAHKFAGIRELPVTCFVDAGPVGHGRLRPMQVTALGARELTGLLVAAHCNQSSIIVIVTHPFEFIKKRDFRYADLRPNRLVQARFRRLCAFLAANADKFEVMPLAAAAAVLDDGVRQETLIGNPFRSMARAAANIANDRLSFI